MCRHRWHRWIDGEVDRGLLEGPGRPARPERFRHSQRGSATAREDLSNNK